MTRDLVGYAATHRDPHGLGGARIAVANRHQPRRRRRTWRSWFESVPARHGLAQLTVPCTLDANEMKIVAPNRLTEGEQVMPCLRDTFDMLLGEGTRMIWVGLHALIAARPAPTQVHNAFVRSDAGIDIVRHGLEGHSA